MALDLYCGIGTIGIFVAKYFKKIYGIEIVEQAIEDAKENAKINKIENIKFYSGDVEKILPELINTEKIKPDVVFVDPPRKGLDNKTIEILNKTKPEQVIYISCNPATMVRDLQKLENDYIIKEIQPVDMFPHTARVEAVVKMSKRDINHHIDLEINEDDLKDISVKKEATYSEIKDYVFRKFELKVSTLNIAQVKRKLGITERESYNHSKKENQRVPNCPPKKEQAIIDALSWFGMIE